MIHLREDTEHADGLVGDELGQTVRDAGPTGAGVRIPQAAAPGVEALDQAAWIACKGGRSKSPMIGVRASSRARRPVTAVSASFHAAGSV